MNMAYILDMATNQLQNPDNPPMPFQDPQDPWRFLMHFPLMRSAHRESWGPKTGLSAKNGEIPLESRGFCIDWEKSRTKQGEIPCGKLT